MPLETFIFQNVKKAVKTIIYCLGLFKDSFSKFVSLTVYQYFMGIYPALVQFEQTIAIDWINVCYIWSLTKI